MRRILTGAVLAALSISLPLSLPAATPAAQGKGASMTTTAPAQATTTTSTPQSAKPTDTTTQRGPAKTGQPNQSCEDLGNRPGNAMNAPGSAFNPDGNAGTKYAGEQPQNSRNTASVSQYDVACARPSK